MKKYQYIKELSLEDLKNKLTESSQELSRVKYVKAVSELPNYMEIKHNRQMVARLLTELRNRELNQ